MSSKIKMKGAKKTLLDEPNAASVTGSKGKASVKMDLATLQARELRWKQGLKNLSDAEAAYVFGGATTGKSVGDDVEKFGGQLFKLHETDLIEMRILQELHKHPDQSAYILAMKGVYECDTREEIASAIAAEEVKKLLNDQMTALVKGTDLRTKVFVPTLQKSAETWGALYNAPA